MANSRVAQRYAEALLQAALEAKVEADVATDIKVLKQTIEASRDLRRLLRSPIIKKDVKGGALKAVFEGKVSATTVAFLELITEKGRESGLEGMITRFETLNDRRQGIQNMSVASGSKLTGDQEKSIRERFAMLTGKTIRMDVRVDEKLLGGFSAKVGDTVFDATIKRQLEIMRQRILESDGTN